MALCELGRRALVDCSLAAFFAAYRTAGSLYEAGRMAQIDDSRAGALATVVVLLIAVFQFSADPDLAGAAGERLAEQGSVLAACVEFT